MLDALRPVRRRRRASVDAGQRWRTPGPRPSRSPRKAAAATAELRPKIGRARPLAERSIGTPDAGRHLAGHVHAAPSANCSHREGELAMSILRIVVGSDDAGLEYKEILQA